MTQNNEILRYAREHAGEAIEDISAEAKLQIRKVIVAYFENSLGDQKSGAKWPNLASALFDRFATLNLDFDLIAQTERSECQLQGFIATVAPGKTVKRVEAYDGACCLCQAISGQTYTIVSPDAPDKDWNTQVWRGKSRIYSLDGKSVPPGSWPSAGLQHPGCRGGWTFALPDYLMVDSSERIKFTGFK